MSTDCIKSTHMATAAASSNGIAVAIRVRPLNERERKVHKAPAWRVDSESSSIVQLDASGKPVANSSFAFDHVFDEASSTDEIYVRSAKQVVRSVMEGINGTIFAYGQTSSGKSFTMNGDKKCPGIIPMAIDDIFSYIQTVREFLCFASAESCCSCARSVDLVY
jgi:centromeric protein E